VCRPAASGGAQGGCDLSSAPASKRSGRRLASWERIDARTPGTSTGHLLTATLGWSGEDYQDWIGEAMCDAVLVRG
jgi:hypothetical protein